MLIPPDGGAPVGPWAEEPLLIRDRVVGAITSATFAPSLEGSVALALVESEAARPGTRLEVEILGARRAAAVVAVCGPASG